MVRSADRSRQSGQPSQGNIAYRINNPGQAIRASRTDPANHSTQSRQAPNRLYQPYEAAQQYEPGRAVQPDQPYLTKH